MDKAELLVIDDEAEMLVSYKKILAREGYQVQTFQEAERALARLSKSHAFSLAICDLKMPGMDGMAFLSAVKERHPYLPVIMVTGYGALETAFEAVKGGAFDFIEKPFSSKKLLHSIDKALLEIVPPQTNGDGSNEFDGMVGQHPEMLRVFELILRISYGNANVLITGESGVGKELVARSIHKHSLRRNRPLIPINCGALPNDLFESELFGYERGAFTGAFQSKPGLVELANGGTLFLDEICEMSQGMQVKLLRMLEERMIRRVGGKKEIPVDVRIVTATNRNVAELLESGMLREDFYYRINTIEVHIPPLQDRVEDVPLLARHFLRTFNLKHDRGIKDFDAAALQAMARYSWPGNVRELQNVIERTYYLANPPSIRYGDLPTYLTSHEGSVDEQASWKELPYREAKDQAIEAFEREYLTYHLAKSGRNISQAASECGVDRRTLHRLINRYHLHEEE